MSENFYAWTEDMGHDYGINNSNLQEKKDTFSTNFVGAIGYIEDGENFTQERDKQYHDGLKNELEEFGEELFNIYLEMEEGNYSEARSILRDVEEPLTEIKHRSGLLEKEIDLDFLSEDAGEFYNAAEEFLGKAEHVIGENLKPRTAVVADNTDRNTV